MAHAWFRVFCFCLLSPVCLLANDVFTYSPSNAEIPNPERGVHGFIHLETPPPDWGYYANLHNNDLTLTYAALTLSEYRRQNLDSQLLANLTNHFLEMRAAGVKAILRINYNNGGNGEDTSLEWMETHLQQLKPLLNTYRDVIAFIQAGMIGQWGEWHGSTNGLDTEEGRAAVWSLLTTYMPPCIPIQVRTPHFVEMLRQGAFPILETQAFECSSLARLGHHNDCWLANNTDTGTYSSNQDRLTTLALLQEDTRYVPWGSETCAPCERCDCTTLLAEAEQVHATYLNNASLENNRLSSCRTTIRKKLGYRFELQDASLPKELFAGRPFQVTIRLKNIGWAPLYNERPVFLRLYAPTPPVRVLAEYALNTDPRFWAPEEGEIAISGTFTAPAQLETGLTFALWMPDQATRLRDDPDFSIQFANLQVWDKILGHNILAKGVSIQALPETQSLQALAPWVVNNADFQSRVAVYNNHSLATTLRLEAVSRTGEKREAFLSLPAKGVRSFEAAEMFPNLSGYSLYFHSEFPDIYPTFLSFNVQEISGGNSPSQAAGVRIEETTSHLLFPYLPGDQTSALVLVAPEVSAGQTEVILVLYGNSDVELARTQRLLLANRPTAILLQDLFPTLVIPKDAAVRALSQNGQRLAGTAFIFNDKNQPSMEKPISLPPP